MRYIRPLKVKRASKSKMAKRLRRDATPSELRMKLILKGLGFSFQLPVCGYIPDFTHPLLRLIVEVDGGYHFSAHQRASDRIREYNLLKRGYQVIRFTNQQVTDSPDITRDAVVAAMQRLGAYFAP